MRFQIVFFVFIIVSNLFGQVDTITENDVQTQSLFIDAIQFKLIDRHDQSIPKFREILKKEPKNAIVWYELAYGLTKTKKYGEALDAVNKSIELKINQTIGLELLSEIYHQEQNFTEEAKMYAQLIKANSKQEKYYTGQVAALKAEAKWEEAIKVLSMLEQNKGYNEISSLEKANIFEHLGKIKDAEKELIKLNQEFPNEIRYLHTLAGFYQKQKSDKSLEVYKSIYDLDPSDERANLALAGNFKKSGNDNQYLLSISTLIENPAVSIDAKIIELIPYVQKASDSKDQKLFEILEKHAFTIVAGDLKNPKSNALLADIYFLQNKNLNAFQYYQKAIEAGKCPKPVWNNLITLANEFQSNHAVVTFTEDAFDQFPNDANFAVEYCKALLFVGRDGEAKSILNQASLMAGDQKHSQGNLKALKYILSQNENDGINANTLAKDPILNESPEAIKLIAKYFIEHKMNPSQADLWLKTLIKMAPKDESVLDLANKAEVLTKTSKDKKLKSEILLPASLSNDVDINKELNNLLVQIDATGSKDVKAESYLIVANLYFQYLGDLEKARQAALKSILNNPNLPHAYKFLGELYVASALACNDDWAAKLVNIAAIDKYKKAIELDSQLNLALNNKIKELSQNIPSQQDAFIRGLKEDQELSLPCGLQDKVRLRFIP